MRLLAITDLHDTPDTLRRILTDAGPRDLALLGGDVTNFGSPDDARRLVSLAQTGGAPVLAVAGNCDSAAIDARLEQLGVSIGGRGVMIGDVGIHGLSAMPPWRKGMYQFTEDELAAMLEAGYAQIDGAARHVVLSHAPPRGCRVDRTHLFQHAGSMALRAFIERTQPDLVLCGHIHEARGVDHLGRTTIVNCGPAAAGYYALADIGGDTSREVRVELRRIRPIP